MKNKNYKKYMVFSILLLLIGSVSALTLPFISDEMKARTDYSPQRLSDVPDILDNINDIITNIYWWTFYNTPRKLLVSGGSVATPSIKTEPEAEPEVEEEPEEEFSKGLQTAMKMARYTDCMYLNVTEHPDCEDIDLNNDGVVDVFDLAIIGNEA